MKESKKTKQKQRGRLGFFTKLCYGAGNLGYGSMGQTVSSFIMFFGTSVLGLPGFLVGITIAITSLWDGISDPIVGNISDKTRSKLFGRRLGHMLFASFALAANNVLLWLCPQFHSHAAIMAWLLIFLLLQETFNTFFATPYSALCIDIAPDYNDQTKMQGFKTVFYILGLIMPSVLMYLFMPAGAGAGAQAQFNRMGYVHIALVNSALVLICGLVSIVGTHRRVRSMPNYSQALEEFLPSESTQNLADEKYENFLNQKCENFEENKKTPKILQFFQKKRKKTEKNPNFQQKEKFQKNNCENLQTKNLKKSGLKKAEKVQKHKSKKLAAVCKSLGQIMAGYVETFKKPNFRTVMVGYSVALIASVFITSVGMHLFTFCYHFSSIQISTLMICLFGGAILSQMLWVNVVKKYDKKQTLIFALCVMLFGIALTSVTFLFRTYTTSDRIFWYVLPCLFVCGIGSGALYSLPHSMYADVVTMEQYKTGENNAGRYTGYYTFTYNFSNSIALLVIGFLLDMVKFNSAQPVQALSVQTGLGRIVFFGSAIALTLAIIVFSKYSIKRSDVLKVQIKAHETATKGKKLQKN